MDFDFRLKGFDIRTGRLRGRLSDFTLDQFDA